MKISFNWLKEYIETDISIDKISEILTDIGLEVEGIDKIGVSSEDLKGFVVGEVLECFAHPNADKLKITKVNLGANQIVQIVCGASNIAQGQKVPVATIGTILKAPDGSTFEIKKAKLRGEDSFGMICSERELNVSDKHDGIWVLDTSLEPGTPMSEVIDTSVDYIIEIGLTPNRADAMSHFGVARDLYAALSTKKIEGSFNGISKNEPQIISGNFSVEIENPDICPAYYGAYIEDVEIKESPEWLKKRLNSVGIKPTNNIVDITNYILHGMGQPMHAFDVNKFESKKVVVKSGFQENFTTLDGIERKLETSDLIISNENKPLAIAGVMGGEDSSVTIDTKNIFLESAYFDPITIRKTAKRLAINSDSSFRYERGIDPSITGIALERAINLITEIAGGKLVEVIKNRPKEIADFEVILHYRKLDSLLGERIHRQKIKEILESLEIEIISETAEILELRVPSYRVDVQREVDVIEEILRIYGYNSIPQKEKVSFSIVKGEGFDKNDFVNHISNFLVSHGFFEAMNISMYSQEIDDKVNAEGESISLINSLSKDYTVMRRSLIPELLQNIQYNLNRKTESLSLFEIGHIYQKTEKGYVEPFKLGLAVSGTIGEAHWQGNKIEKDIYFLKGILESLLKSIGVFNTSFVQDKDELNLFVSKDKIGSLKTFDKGSKIYDLSQNVVCAELDLQLLFDIYKQQKVQYKSISKFPIVTRDLAILLDKNVYFEQVIKVINNLNIEEIKETSLFDVYEGEKLKDKKSYAIRLKILDPIKTMTDKEIDSIMNRVISSLEKELKASLRN